MSSYPKPTKAEVQAAYGKTAPDIIAPNLDVLFCGINPSIYSAAVGHHFARPGNRLWKTLHASGFTPYVFHPSEDQNLLALGVGMTNMCDRATARADELSTSDLVAGHQSLAEKVKRYQPKVLSILGISAYRTAWNQPKASLGRQSDLFHGAIVWVLPNPSGLNAHYQLDNLARVYGELYQHIAAHTLK
ncbi:MAG: G/U mismatch-specific DNA glycosylase [Leptolyngbyaceae bacterium]|nr:G/U mismatch-specific DNA glycosylase [Leptolyngbyaceae bacterium]